MCRSCGRAEGDIVMLIEAVFDAVVIVVVLLVVWRK
jgi:hypothetical protein